MAKINVDETEIKKKNSKKPRKTLYLRKTVINGQNLKRAAARRRLVPRQ